MTHSTEQPEAQRLIDWFEESGGFNQGTKAPHKWVLQAEQELRRLHARVQELEAERTVRMTQNTRMAERIAELESKVQHATPVPVELLERIQESLGSFVSDQGWAQSDVDTADALDGLLAAAAPQPPGAAPVVLPEYGIDTANHVGIRVRGYTEQQVRELLAAPKAELVAWYVTGCNTLLDEHDAKAEAKRCGGTAKAVPLYAAARHTNNTRNNT